MTKKKPFETFEFPMPSADGEQKFYRRRFRFRVTSRLAPAAIKSSDSEAGDLQLVTYLTVKLFERDIVKGDALKRKIGEELVGLAPPILKLLEGVYTAPSGEELPMIDKHGNRVCMPLFEIKPSDRDGGHYVRVEEFSIASLAHFLKNNRFWTPEEWPHREPPPFRQAVGAQMTQSSAEDESKHSSKLQFTGAVFGRAPFGPTVVEADGKRMALFPEHSQALGFAAIIPSALVNELLRTYHGMEPFFQNIVYFYTGFTMPDEAPEVGVRGLLAAPREQHKPEAKAERRSETLDERVARLTIELAEHEQKAEAAKGTPGEAKAKQKLGGVRGHLSQAKAQLEKKADESSEAPAPPAPEA
jgi:hypothetical protein